MHRHLARSLAFVLVAILLGIGAAAAVLFLRGDARAPSPEETATDEAATPAGVAYASEAYSFSATYPEGFVPDESYADPAAGPGRELPGVSFRVPARLTAGTNLSEDSAIAVLVLRGATTCSASAFLDGAAAAETTEDGRAWTVARSSDAGAGNLYESVVHATGGADACYGVRLLAHSTQLANYEPGTVAAYDRDALDDAYASFRRSFRVLP